jgi:DNA-binding SARP family transcriptional activator
VQGTEFRVLGPLEVVRDGRALELRRPKQRSLLALLLLHGGEIVSTDGLVDGLWGARPPKTAVGSLQNLVSELRKALGRDLVKTKAPGYRLEVAREQVDLHRFEDLVARAAEARDPQRRASYLREALGFWRGPPLADLAYEPFAQVAIVRLEEQRTAAREELVDADLDLGRHSQLVAELEALVAEHPLRERLRGQLMLALYRSGRQAEALDAYRAARETLVEELGIDPSEELQRLEQAILRHDPALDAAPQDVAAPAEPTRRKTVTVLFTDVVDSTSLSAQLDPEVVRGVMGRYFDTVRTIVERHGGVIEKFIGDAAMAAFGLPQVHEDDALRAVRAALELRDSLDVLNTELQRDHAVAIQIRTAINSGEVVAGDSTSGQSFATGSAVNVAMRLQQAALPGETLLGATTARLVEDNVTIEPVEAVDLGGSLGPQAAFRLVALAPEAGHGRPVRGPLVGRREELAQLDAALESVRRERRSRVLTVLGDAGIGKSRLVAEFASSVGEEASTLVGRCVSYGEGATYLPLAEIVHQAVPKRPHASITSLLAGDEDAGAVAQRLLELTGGAERGTSSGEIFWAIRRLFEGLARQRPLVVILEDVHWAEPTLLDLIEYLGAWIFEAPVLVLCIARPHLLEMRPGWRVEDEAIVLAPLSDEEAATLVKGLAREEDLGHDVRSRIVEAAEGNPLFVEQLHAHVADFGPAALEAVPPSIDALIAGRLERLEPEERSTIERAAVIGKDFRRSAVLHLTRPEGLAAVDAALLSLERKQLVHALRPTGADEEALRFQHVLVRDVAYAGITKGDRSDLHERHAAWLDHRQEADELVGYHAEQAHRYRAELRPSDPKLPQLARWAGERIGAAGIGAWKRADTPATVNLLGRAVALLPPDSTDRAELLCELGVAQRGLGELDRADDTLAEAIAAASASRDRRVEFRSRIEQARTRVFDEQRQTADELVALVAQAVPVFEEMGDDLALGRAWRHLGNVRGGIQGRLADWQEAAERALVHYRRSGWSVSGCLVELAAALFYGPAPVSEGLRRCEELLGEATERLGTANVLAFMAGLHALGGDLGEARHVVSEAASTYEEIGEVYAIANNSGRVLSRIELLAGNPAAAERVLRQCCETFEQVHDQAGLSTLAAELADALYLQSRYDEAEAWIELAERSALRDDLSAQYWRRRVRAKLLARAQRHQEAETIALEAATLTERTDALNDCGVVMLDVAEVYRLADRPADAAGFVEQAKGFFERKGNVVSTAEARTRLDELAVA